MSSSRPPRDTVSKTGGGTRHQNDILEGGMQKNHLFGGFSPFLGSPLWLILVPPLNFWGPPSNFWGPPLILNPSRWFFGGGPGRFGDAVCAPDVTLGAILGVILGFLGLFGRRFGGERSSLSFDPLRDFVSPTWC